MKIVILDGGSVNPGDLDWKVFESLGDLVIYESTSKEELVEHIGDAEIILMNKAPIRRETMEKCPKLKYIGIFATGYNLVDVDAAKELGITVTNVPNYSTDSVAQFVFSLLLEICSGVGRHCNSVKQGNWSNEKSHHFWEFPLIELADKTLGIIGFGRIGRRTAQIAKAFGMNVIAWGGTPTEEGRALAEYVDKEELFARADIISLHCPLFPETREIINKDTIALMKDGVIIINTARGPLIAEQDLFDALESGKVAAAGLDVVSKEPIKSDNPLLKAKNCYITPHIAWAPGESRKRLIEVAASNVRAFIDGMPENVVNK